MKKKTKFSLGMKIVTLLTVITMASVGFAAWVITAPVVEKETAGAISVDTVEDPVAAKLVFGEPEWVTKGDKTGVTNTAEDKNVIKFGKPAEEDKDPSIKDAWLDNAGEMTEKLEAYFKFTVTVNDPTANISLALKTTAGENVTNVFGEYAAYITPSLTAKIYNAEGNEVVLTCTPNDSAVEDENKYFNLEINTEDVDEGTVLSIYVTVKINWGTIFGDINPYNYYNKLDYNSNYSAAQTALETLELLQGTTYKVIIGAAA